MSGLRTGPIGDVSYTPFGDGVEREIEGKLQEFASPEDAGCVGDGGTDDTVNLNKVLAAHKVVRLTPGKTYLVTALTAPLSDQVIQAHGATVKLKDAQASGFILTVSGNRSKVLGGTWDGNRANQTGSTFSYANIRITGSYCEVAHTYQKDSRGIGIMGVGGDYNDIHHNQANDCRGYGIYVEKTTADGVGNRITDNLVTNTTDAASCGIYLTGMNSPFTFKQKNWMVRGNVCVGPTAAPTGVGITVRGVDGVCSENSTEGFAIGVSCDITSDSVISGNRCFNPGGAGYCLEVNAGGNTITGNKTMGGVYGLAMSLNDATLSMNDNVISGNQFKDPSSRGIYVNATIATALRLNITNNTIRKSSGSGSAIYLTGSCQYARISGNLISGAGSGVANTRAVYLDSVNSNVAIDGNTFIGVERAVTCYNNTATAYTDILFHNNDCREDVLGTPSYLAAEGTATIGDRCSMLWNKQNTTSSNHKHTLDVVNNRVMEWSNSFVTPEANVSAGVGSLYINTNGGAGTTLYVKQTGTGNTGWAGK
jgi:hypothetical protein